MPFISSHIARHGKTHALLEPLSCSRISRLSSGASAAPRASAREVAKELAGSKRPVFGVSGAQYSPRRLASAGEVWESRDQSNQLPTGYRNEQSTVSKTMPGNPARLATAAVRSL
jgi:hypothetical protein